MIQIDLPTLVKRLNLFSRQALEMAASECMSQQAAEITVSHVLIQMLAMPRSDLRVITRQGDIGMEELRQALTVENYTTARSADSYPAFSPMLVEWLKEGWLLASAEMQHSELRGGVLLLALLHSPLRYIPPAAARLLTGINRDRLQQDFVQWTQESAESVVPDADGKGAGTMTDASDTLLARYAKNMTADARNGRLDPVLCRDHEIDLMIDILCRRRKNNPVVVGEAGVGKSALIEGLALRIVAGQVPDKLKNTDIMTLDLGALQAGASVKGEFEKRFKGLMAEVISSPVPVILFIDEAHTLIGAGNQQGGLDISNLLKPALARGELKTIAATTWSEYKKYFEKDAALSRRFQLVKVSEPNAAEATIKLQQVELKRVPRVENLLYFMQNTRKRLEPQLKSNTENAAQTTVRTLIYAPETQASSTPEAVVPPLPGLPEMKVEVRSLTENPPQASVIKQGSTVRGFIAGIACSVAVASALWWWQVYPVQQQLLQVNDTAQGAATVWMASPELENYERRLQQLLDTSPVQPLETGMQMMRVADSRWPESLQQQQASTQWNEALKTRAQSSPQLRGWLQTRQDLHAFADLVMQREKEGLTLSYIKNVIWQAERGLGQETPVESLLTQYQDARAQKQNTDALEKQINERLEGVLSRWLLLKNNVMPEAATGTTAEK